jgi:nitronate monooxygenase
MNFDGGSAKAKAWRDIWGAGQGVGAIKRVLPAAELVAQFTEEYQAARRRLGLAAA